MSNYVKITIILVLNLTPWVLQGKIFASTNNLMSKNYILFEIAKNNPVIHTQNEFDGHKGTYVVGYRHVLDSNWIMGLNTSFKSLIRKEDREPLSFLTLNHEAFYITRLYHDIYFLSGPKFFYLFPARGEKFPLQRQPEYESGFGAALSLSIIIGVSESFNITARIDRWRSTETNRFHGTEAALGINYGLKN